MSLLKRNAHVAEWQFKFKFQNQLSYHMFLTVVLEPHMWVFPQHSSNDRPAMGKRVRNPRVEPIPFLHSQRSQISLMA